MIYVIIYIVILYKRKEAKSMAEIIKTMKLHLHVKEDNVVTAFKETTATYTDACNYVSEYTFNNGFELNSNKLQKVLYSSVRSIYGLKSQFAVSVFKTVTARYKTIQEQMKQSPYKYQDEAEKWHYIPRTLEWLYKPVYFQRPQADLVRGRDYSFVEDGTLVSVNTLGKRVKLSFDQPDCFREYFDGTWSFGTAKLVSLNNEWYMHIPMTKVITDELDITKPVHVVGIDRGLRFIVSTYDEKGKTSFNSGRDIMAKRQKFADVRAELQSKGTKSAKRALKRLSGRENRWMSDVNHQISKTLVQTYGAGTLFVLEDLTGVSFSDENLTKGSKSNRDLRSWTFYQLEQFLTYKAHETGSEVIKVSANYTSQRCPKCGRIHKENRNHKTHEYICDSCGYHSNDDRVGAMNIYTLGTMFVSGDTNPRFGVRKVN